MLFILSNIERILILTRRVDRSKGWGGEIKDPFDAANDEKYQKKMGKGLTKANLFM